MRTDALEPDASGVYAMRFQTSTLVCKANWIEPWTVASGPTAIGVRMSNALPNSMAWAWRVATEPKRLSISHFEEVVLEQAAR